MCRRRLHPLISVSGRRLARRRRFFVLQFFLFHDSCLKFRLRLRKNREITDCFISARSIIERADRQDEALERLMPQALPVVARGWVQGVVTSKQNPPTPPAGKLRIGVDPIVMSVEVADILSFS